VNFLSKRILVVDDNRLIVNLLRVNLLSSGYEVITASDGFSALRMAINERPDLILLDVMMPEMDGFEVARQIRNNTLIAHVPIIMLTARGSVDSVVEGLDAGADDYISKPFEMTEVLARVKAHLRRSRSERSLSPMTGLPGNITIEEELKQLVAKDEPYSVVYADIDNFKSFNDCYGFLHGDEAIKLLAGCVLGAVRSYGNHNDFVGHIGGDDFVICTTPDHVDGICQEIIRHFGEQILGLYRPEHREQGYVVGVSRDGKAVHHALVTLSLAVVSNEHREITSHWEIGEIAADLKRAAKHIDHSVYIKDMRSGRSTALDQAHYRNSSEPVGKVILLTSDWVLEQVAPVVFGRVGLIVANKDKLDSLSTTDCQAIILDEDCINAVDQSSLISCMDKGVFVYLLQSQDSSMFKDFPASNRFLKPLNINSCAARIRGDVTKERNEC